MNCLLFFEHKKVEVAKLRLSRGENVSSLFLFGMVISYSENVTELCFFYKDTLNLLRKA